MDGRTVWVQPGDVDGRIEAGNVVTAAVPLSDWCLRGDDGSTPIAAGSALEIVEERSWGASMAMELPALSEATDAESAAAGAAAWLKAARELELVGLFEVVTETLPECTADGDIKLRERAVRMTQC